MNKISTQQKQAVLAEVPTVLRALVEERDMYKSKLAAYETRNRVEKLASQMIDKGIEEGSVKELADRLEKQAAHGDINLNTLTDAVELVGANMMRKNAHLSDELDPFAHQSAFEREILA